MDSDGFIFQTAIDPVLPNVPIRRRAAMPAQDIIAWSPLSLMAILAGWLTAEAPIVATVRIQNNRRA